MIGLQTVRGFRRVVSHDFSFVCPKRSINTHIRKVFSPIVKGVELSKDKQIFFRGNNKAIRNITSENEYLVKIKHDLDVFGSPCEVSGDGGDLKEERHFEEQASHSSKLSTKQYADMIKSLILKNKIKEAIEILEVRMIKEDKVKPENYIFNLILGACGQVGYTKKAFALYNKMKQRGLQATGGTYTALFNACANSPWAEDGLIRATQLRNIMIEKMYEPNDTNYNAMIKAFGRCGDLTTAFSLVDEMTARGFKLNDSSINFLLHACITDKEAGFRHALLVWRKMINLKIKPSVFTYNLMLRCIRDCNLGDFDTMQDVLYKILPKKSMMYLTEGNRSNKDDNIPYINKQDEGPLIDGIINIENSTNPISNNLAPEYIQIEASPNLLAETPHLGSMLSLSEVLTPQNRLLLVGGMRGYLTDMKERSCTPDIKTFTLLLDSIPSTIAAENELLITMKSLNVRFDIDFYNMLIKKRSLRFDYQNAKDVLTLMARYKFRPNLITYGILSMGCKTKEEAQELLAELKSNNYRINIEILGAMMSQACYHNNFRYVLELMEMCIKEEIRPNNIFIAHLASFKKKCNNISNDKRDKLSQNQGFQKGFKVFRMRYKTWLEEVELDDSDNIHPWQQYRETTTTDTRHYDGKHVTRFKPRHISKFKVKTSTKNLIIKAK